MMPLFGRVCVRLGLSDRRVVVAVVAVLLVLSSASARTQTPADSAEALDKARLLYTHGLVDDARRDLIDIVFAPGGAPAARASARYLLGEIAFDEGDTALAVETWRALVDEHPGSPEARRVAADLDALAQGIQGSAGAVVDSLMARGYLRSAEFWSEEKDSLFRIDSSWISSVDGAVYWYDRVIVEFAGTAAAERAYVGKLRTLFGWEGRGRYGEPEGLRASFAAYMPRVLETFTAFQEAHPEAGTLQGFRYQIAQAYWRENDWDSARRWLALIMDVGGDPPDFYGDLAARRLENLGPSRRR